MNRRLFDYEQKSVQIYNMLINIFKKSHFGNSLKFSDAIVVLQYVDDCVSKLSTILKNAVFDLLKQQMSQHFIK